MGFEEVSPSNVHQNIDIIGDQMISKINGNSYHLGKLEIPSLQQLRDSIQLSDFEGNLEINEIVGNVIEFHCLSENKNALFQAASQFNLLEMASPEVVPEKGVDIYENDHTQGPSCAIACGAGTIYRNYFFPQNGKLGQSRTNQIDCLKKMGHFLRNEDLNLWKMKNGYAFASEGGLTYLTEYISNLNFQQREELKGLLQVGIQWNTQVTLVEEKHLVSQIYCSALPIGYSYIPEPNWKNFAKLILEATYEATFYASLMNFKKTGCNKVFLTLVGGGVFGNKMEWILDAIKYSTDKFRNTPLDIKIISYGQSNYLVKKMIEEIK